MNEKRKLTKLEIFKYINLSISSILVLLLLIGIGNNKLNGHYDFYIFQFIAATYVQFVFGYWIYLGALKEWFKSHSLGMDTLVTLGTLVPYIYSLYLACGYWTNNPNIDTFDPFFSAGATIVLAVSIGENISYSFQQRLSNQITELNDKKATNANLILKDENIKTIQAKELKIDDNVLVKKGEIIPADGLLISNFATIDESSFNGEVNFSEKTQNDIIYGGSINMGQPIILKVVNLYKDSMINQLIKKAQKVQGAKLNVTKKLDIIAAWFTPVMIILSIFFFIIQFYFGKYLPDLLIMSKNYTPHNYDVSVSIYYAIGVLVGACPCIFGIAIPIVIAASSGKFLKHGILLNKGKSFELIKNTNAIAFDKTGTITQGKFSIEHIHGEEKYKFIFYALSKLSNHPLSLSFVKTIEDNLFFVENIKISDFKEIPGVGLSGLIDGEDYKIVNKNYLQNNNVSWAIEKCSTEQPLITFSYLIKNNEVVLEVQFIDSIKPGSYQALKELKSMGYKTFLITGDNELNANFLKKELGFDEVYARVLPEGKLEIVKKIQEKYNVIFVGDGLNDIEALQQANVSIAMNSGNSISKSVSDFVVLDNDVKSVVDAIKIIKQAIKTIKINIIWAIFYNLLIVPLSGVGIIMPIISAVLMGVWD